MLYSNQNQLVLAIILASFVIYVVHVFIFPLYDASPKSNDEYRGLLSLEKTLCKSNLKPMKVPQAWRGHCPRDGIVTVAQGGRLGNQIWEYASVWALARRTGLEAYVPRCISKSLGDAFEKLSIPPLAYVGHCPAPREQPVSGLEAWNHTGQSILLPRYAALPELVLSWTADIRKELSFKASLRERARRVLVAVGEQLPHPPRVYVAVHVRRTDYRHYLWRTRTATLAEPSYFHKAIAYFERKFKSVLFVVLSDDPAWCEERLSEGRANVRVLSGGAAAEDLALMAACNHSIIDYGTFGVWGAILAGGETVLYNISRHSSVRVGQLLPHWRIMS
ncbi:galactoside 2-alpha-L-fucosyltransferase SEC1-like [Arctopsyche grandis]|uniref:galactoside 2-alpha-L-fucosyltransferase SEC1-like n=1 Tax=Arctopsyche grandis TaxID=121162 RepID=UPI00406D81A1